MKYTPPVLSSIMRDVVNLSAVNPAKWANTYELYGWTPQMVADAVEAERLFREGAPTVEVGDAEE